MINVERSGFLTKVSNAGLMMFYVLFKSDKFSYLRWLVQASGSTA